MGAREITLIALLMFLPDVTSLFVPKVMTTSGQVRGEYNLLFNVAAYRGIPYGKARRFEDPSPAESWVGERDCRKFGPMCPQQPCTGDLAQLLCSQESEDCLFLNVYAPQGERSLLPVIMWIHGGGYETGTASSSIYDGVQLSNMANVVVVTVNYRLGPLGFLATFHQTTGAVSGNWGLKDQILALRWIQQNIAGFGGDPHQVTIMGQSAGAQSISVLLTSNPSDPEVLFHKAILHSLPGSLRFRNCNDARTQAEAFATYVGCPFNDLDCYRGVPLDLVKQAQNSVQVREALGNLTQTPGFASTPFGPVVDGTLVQMQFLDALATGHFRPMPIMAGTTEDEGILYALPYANLSRTPQEYKELGRLLFPDDTVADVLTQQRYPAGSDVFAAMSRLLTDYSFACPTRLLARTYAEAGQPVWLWVFDQPLPFPFQAVLGEACVGKSCHGGDVAFVFNFQPPLTPPLAALTVQSLAEQIATRWGRFAASKTDPNTFLMFPKWPRYQRQSPSSSIRLLSLFTSLDKDYHRDACDYLDSLGYPVS